MKNKFIVLTLCFTLFFSSINLKKSYANPLVAFAPEIIAVIGTIAVGSGIILNSNDDVLDVSRIFYDKHKESIDVIEDIFKATVSVGANGVVNVGKDFLDLCKDAFDSYFNVTLGSSVSSVGSVGGVPTYNVNSINDLIKMSGTYFPSSVPTGNFTVGDFLFKKKSAMGTEISYDVYLGQSIVKSNLWIYKSYFTQNLGVLGGLHSNGSFSLALSRSFTDIITLVSYSNTDFDYSLPYVPGSYDWEKHIGSNVANNGSVDVFVPGNTYSLPGISSDVVFPGNDFLNPPYDLPIGGTVTVPGVNNPSIDIGGNIVIPGVDVVDPPLDVPSDSVFEGIKDFIISLVVPSDTYWIDKFNTIKTAMLNKFPGVDVSELDKLLVGETPFPNIDVSVMGVKSSRILDSDSTINGIVSTVRPWIQAFVSVFLFLFVYNQIYYLIRGTRPISVGGKGGND